MRTFMTGCLAACLLLGGVAPARGQQASALAAAAPARSPAALQPGDLIRLRIWREDGLSGEFAVNERGEADLPMLGPVAVAGVDPDVLRAQLVEGYRKYLKNPTIDVVFMRRVRILGAVEKPGLYPVDGTMTVADALALAGGAREMGRIDAIEIVRDGKRILSNLRQDTKLSDTPIQSGDQIFVPDRRWLARNPGVVPTLISGGFSILSMIVLLIVR